MHYEIDEEYKQSWHRNYHWKKRLKVKKIGLLSLLSLSSVSYFRVVKANTK